MLRVTFVMEQHLGHQTYYQNLRRFIENEPRIKPTWIPVTYEEPGGVIEKIPLLPRHARGLLRGVQDTRVPALLAGISYWAIGLPAGYLLAFPLGMGPAGLWAGLLIGLCVAAVLMLRRFYAGLARGDWTRARAAG